MSGPAEGFSPFPPLRLWVRTVACGSLVAALAFLLLLLPGRAAAQGSCSVPHGSPASPAGQSALTQDPGTGWVQATVYHLSTRRQFNELGTDTLYFSDGRLVTTSLIVTGVVGVVRGVDVWAQLPIHRLRFAEATGAREATGIGDPRFYLRVGPQAFGLPADGLPLAVALRGGVKLPGAEFPVDQQLIPITEGQRDWELLVELGRRFDPFYLMGWAGYRWREENLQADRDPGDERFAYLAIGADLVPLSWRVGLQALSGRAPHSLGYAIPTARRRMVEILPTLGRRLGPGELQLGGRIALSGRNLPAGEAFSVGYFVTWGGRSTPDPKAVQSLVEPR